MRKHDRLKTLIVAPNFWAWDLRRICIYIYIYISALSPSQSCKWRLTYGRIQGEVWYLMASPVCYLLLLFSFPKRDLPRWNMKLFQVLWSFPFWFVLLVRKNLKALIHWNSRVWSVTKDKWRKDEWWQQSENSWHKDKQYRPRGNLPSKNAGRCPVFPDRSDRSDRWESKGTPPNANPARNKALLRGY